MCSYSDESPSHTIQWTTPLKWQTRYFIWFIKARRIRCDSKLEYNRDRKPLSMRFPSPHKTLVERIQIALPVIVNPLEIKGNWAYLVFFTKCHDPLIFITADVFLSMACNIDQFPSNTKQFCITFIHCRTNVEDVGPTLFKCYTNVVCLIGYALFKKTTKFSISNSTTLYH